MRIIVADDEYFARKALVKNIGQLDEEIECCEEAEDGIPLHIKLHQAER